jgi:hypothetical protein
MGAADERIGELLDRWLASVERHARYLELDDAAYARVQDWPRHQRPTRWVVDLARARLLELKRQLTERQTRRDESFAESLELMAFLTNLLGSEHLERFIPLAVEPAKESPPPVTPATKVAPAEPDATVLAPALARTLAPPPASDATVLAPALRRPGSPPPAPRKPGNRKPAPDATVLVPALGRARPPAAAATPPADATVLAPTLGRPRTPPPGKPAAAPAARSQPPPLDKTAATVIADAVRFLRWGRDWSQLASVIARLASRPPEAEVAEILRRYRADIEARAREPRV